MNQIERRVNVKLVGQKGKAGDRIVLCSGPIIKKFRGMQLFVGGAASNICQLFVDGKPCMPSLPEGILGVPSVVFGSVAFGNELTLPACPAGKEIKLEVVLDVDGEVEAHLLGEAA